MTDDLVRHWTDEPPRGVRWRREVRDHVVIATEMPRRVDHVVLPENRVGQRHGIAGLGLAIDEPQDLAALLVHADDARRLEPFPLEKTQERVNGWCPRTGQAMHRVTDADGIVEIASERSFLRHGGKRLGALDVVNLSR